MSNDSQRGRRSTSGRFDGQSGRDAGRLGGRPSEYTEAIAEEICTRLMEGQSLNAICDNARMPHRVTVWRWVEDDLHGFRNRYARARMVQATTLADEAMDLLRQYPENMAAVSKCRELARHIQWLAERFDRDSYGPQQRIEVQNPARAMSQEERERQIVEGCAKRPELIPVVLQRLPDLEPKIRAAGLLPAKIESEDADLDG